MRLLKRLRCQHENQTCLTNVYGDYINTISTKNTINRSIWVCERCGKFIYLDQVNPECKVSNWVPEK